MAGLSTSTMIMMGVTLAATAASTYAGIQGQAAQREAQKAQADYQSQVAQRNQELADEQARAQRQEGYQNMIKKRQETAKLVGAQRAKAGASGAVVDFGSSLDVNMDTVEQGEFDALAEYQKGLNGAYSAEIQKWNYGQQAAGYQMQSASADAGSGWGTAAAITGGIASFTNSMATKDLWGVGNKGQTYDRALGQYTNSTPMH